MRGRPDLLRVSLLAMAVRQPLTWVCLGGRFETAFQSAMEAKPVGSGENLVVPVPDDNGVFYGAETTRMACTTAVQIYVDLAHAGGRGEEAAKTAWDRRFAQIPDPTSAQVLALSRR
jgi:hypothetical protein